MGILDRLPWRRQRWRWQAGSGAPPPDVVEAMVRAVTKGTGADRLAVLEQAAQLTHGCNERGSTAQAAARQLCLGALAVAAAGVLRHADPLRQEELEAILQLTANLALLPDSASHQMLEHSGLIPALIDLLAGPGEQPAGPGPAVGIRAAGTRALQLPPAVKAEILRCLRGLARQGVLRSELKEGLPVIITTLDGAVRDLAFELAGEAAWVLEMLSASRRLCNHIGELGGVRGVVSLLQAALASRPAVKEIPRDAEATEAASIAVHALAVLLADCRANRGRLRAAGGAPLLAEAMGDGQLDWEAKEQAAGLLEELAATLLVDERPLAESPHFQEWRSATVPHLVQLLQQYRGLPHMQQTKEAVAGVLERLAGGCEEGAGLVREAGALQPLVQLLAIGAQMAARERELCCVVLRTLRELAPVSKDALAQASAPSAGKEVQLLDLLGQLAEEGAEADPLALARGFEEESAVRAGWLAAGVVAKICPGHQTNQDAVVSRGMLRPLCAYLQAPLGLRGAVGEAAREAILGIKCEVAEALRSMSLRAACHPALRAASVPQHAQHLLASTVPTWTELRASAKKILQNLGELPDLDRPFLTYSPDQLAHLLQSQGIEAQRFRERGIGGAEFVRLSDADMRDVVLAAQRGRALRMLRAYEVFDDVDSAGARDGCLTLGKLVAYFSGRGFRQEEIVPLAESLMQLMDGDRDDLVAFPDFLQCYDEFRARAMLDVQPPSKRRRTSMAP